MRNIKWQGLIAILLLLSTRLSAQAPMNEDGPVQMADALHANGNIYAVVAVVVLIVVGILIYLIRLDRKITKLENEA